MKVYFTASVSRATPEVREYYQQIISVLEKLGHTVIADHVLGKGKEDIDSQTEAEALDVQKRLSQWKKQADIVLIEASTPSFGVGQEISEALNDNKQIIVMHLPGKKPHILVNQGQDVIYFAEYTPDKIASVLEDYIEYAKTHSDTRFNFFISPQIGGYLDWISRNKKIPRAVYLRQLIEVDMRVNKEYTEATE